MAHKSRPHIAVLSVLLGMIALCVLCLRGPNRALSILPDVRAAGPSLANTSHVAWLPLVFPPCELTEQEPNNRIRDAQGPLPSDQKCCCSLGGHHDDLFWFEVAPGEGTIRVRIEMSDEVGEHVEDDVKLILYPLVGDGVGRRIDKCSGPCCEIDYEGQLSGRYVVQVFSEADCEPLACPYTLQISYPEPEPLWTPAPSATPQPTNTPQPGITPTCELTTCREPIVGAALPGALTITQPQHCAEDLPAAEEIIVKGTHASIAPDDDVWLLLYACQSFRYYPQSDDPSTGQPMTLHADGTWAVATYCGLASTPGEQFELVAVVADATASAFFSQKLIDDHNRGMFTGLRAHELPSSIAEKDSIIVRTDSEPTITPTTTPSPTATQTPTPTASCTPTRNPTPTCDLISCREPISDVALPGTIVITTPVHCTKDMIQEHEYIARGTHADVVLGHDLWLLVHACENDRYYPQSDTPCTGQPVVRKANGTWAVAVFFGGEEPGIEQFDLVAVIADDNASAVFSQYLIDGCNNGGTYIGLRPHQLPSGLTEKDSITILAQ